jgi:hypothetical protein
MKTLFLLIISLPFTAFADCAPALSLETVPSVMIDATAPLVSHTEVFDIAIPAGNFNSQLAAAPLSRLLPGTSKIPAVAETRVLTSNAFGQAGAPRVVCLADGSTAVEEVTESLAGQYFRYKVWAYSTEVARPIEYGLGEFLLSPVDASHTRVTWTYSFKLRSNVFPGNAGWLGRWLFKKSFVERDYADMMRVSGLAMTNYFQADKPR